MTSSRASRGFVCELLTHDTSTQQASLTVPWTVGGVGDYTIVLTATYRGETGVDTEVVTVAQLSAEFPAPPSVANAYINSGADGLKLSGKQRGCVISKIAERHAKESPYYYGPKGGPYVEDLIKGDVRTFAGVCQS